MIDNASVLLKGQPYNFLRFRLLFTSWGYRFDYIDCLIVRSCYVFEINKEFGRGLGSYLDVVTGQHIDGI